MVISIVVERCIFVFPIISICRRVYVCRYGRVYHTDDGNMGLVLCERRVFEALHGRKGQDEIWLSLKYL